MTAKDILAEIKPLGRDSKLVEQRGTIGKKRKTAKC